MLRWICRARRGFSFAVARLAVVAASCGAGGETTESVGESAAAATASQSSWTTDGSPPVTLADGAAVTGVRCRGRYCDDVSLTYSSFVGLIGASEWLPAVSEEQPDGAVCPGDQVVTGLGCSGHYCDDVAIRCSELPGHGARDCCYWTAFVSEEDGGTLTLPDGMVAAGLRCQGRYCDSVSLLACDDDDARPDPDFDALAARFAPRLRFDSLFGSGGGAQSKCFPSDAATYFDRRRRGWSPRSLCNLDYAPIAAGAVPTYYLAEACGSNVVMIRYWVFYVWQSTCFASFGDHAADWESFVVKIENGAVSRVAFVQHGGWYTKLPGDYESAGDHPVVYVGKNAHGGFHESGGRGGCFYFDDYRNPGERDPHMDTWSRLERIDRDASAPAWMTCDGDGCFDGIGHPIDQSGELCSMGGCAKDGCGLSDIGSAPF